MYNRYVPQGDGTFQRNQMPDAPPRPAASGRQAAVQRTQPPQYAPPPPPEPQNEPYVPPLEKPPRQEPQAKAWTAPQPPASWGAVSQMPQNQSASTFFSRFLPKNMDSGDLLMLMILLLLLSDGDEDAPPVLLTIALYFLLKTD